MFQRALLQHRAIRLMSTTGGNNNTSSMLDMFKSVGKYSEQKLKNAKALLMQDSAKEEEEKSFIGHSHGEHAAALERDLLKIVKNQGGHGHSHDGHGHSHDEHGHSHDDGDHGHSHAKTASLEDDDEDFVEMWNHQAPAGPEHGGPRGKEPTRLQRSVISLLVPTPELRPLVVDILSMPQVLVFFNLQDLCQLALVCKHVRTPVLVQFKHSLRDFGVTPRAKRIHYWAHRARVLDLFKSTAPEQEYLNCFTHNARQGVVGLAPTGTSGAILRDVTRTFAHLHQVDHDQLANVLLAVSTYCPAVSYCQGMNYVAATLLMEAKQTYPSALQQECAAFAILCGMIVNLNFAKMWSPGVPQLKLRIFQFDKLLAEHLPELALHFKRIELASDFFVSQWFLTLMSVNFINGELDAIEPLGLVWDVLFTEGLKAIFRVGLHYLDQHQVWLQQQNLEHTCRFLKRGLMHSNNVRMVNWNKASMVTNHRLLKLEREYESHVLLRSSSMVRQMIVLNEDSPVLRSDVTVLRERIERTERALRTSVLRLQHLSKLCNESKQELSALHTEEEIAAEQQRFKKLAAGANQAKVEVEEHLERKRVFSEQLRMVVERNELSRASRLRNLFEEMNL